MTQGPVKFQTLPEEVDVYTVREEIMHEVAEWCDGTVLPPQRSGPLRGVQAIEIHSGGSSMYAFPGDVVVAYRYGDDDELFEVITQEDLDDDFEPRRV